MGHSVEPQRWCAEADRLLARMAGRFARVETRRRVRRFLFGLLADLPLKNCWTIAEHAGEPDPYGMQYFLARARWTDDPERLAEAGVPEDIEFATKPALRVRAVTRPYPAG